jgi:predicted  nucleic acid-binding Zn-ribbon protein
MADNATRDFKRPVPIILAVVALVGWVLAIVFWQQRQSVEEELTAALQAEQSAHAETRTELRQIEQTAGNRDELETIVAALGAERDELEAERDARMQEFTEEREAIEAERQELVAAAEAQREEVGAELAAVRAEREALGLEVEERTAELERLEQELLPRREEIGTFEERLTATEQQLVERSQELAEVGERLEAARQQEADVQARLAELSADAADSSQQALDAEERLQAAREAEAQLELELAAAREAFAQIEAEQEEVQAQVRTLEERREALSADTSAAREQHEALQASLTELATAVAARGDEVRRVEERMSELQAAQAAIDRAAAAGLRPGQYAMGPIAARFGADGAFEMMSADGRQSVAGQYEVEGSRLTLYDVEGDTAWAPFPVECEIQPEARGFSLHGDAEEGTCGLFSGQLFERAL